MPMSPLRCLAAAGLAMFVAAAPARAQQAEQAVLAFPNTSMSFTMAYVAIDLGLWKTLGVNVKEVFVAGPGAANAVIAGSAEFSLSSALVLTRAAAKGQKLLAIANTIRKPQTEIILRKDVAEQIGFDPKAPIEARGKVLKGRSWAIAGVGTPEQMLLRILGKRAGLNPDTDFKTSIMQASSLIPALKAKSIDGFSNSLPWPIDVVEDGSAVLVASSLRGDFPEYTPLGQVMLVTRPQVCSDKPELCRKMAQGLVEAARIMQDQPDRAKDVLRKRLPQIAPAVLDQAYDLVRQSTPNPPLPTNADFENAERYNIAAGLEKTDEKLSSYEDLFTDRYLK
jgi:NitT/TauT family transport system substrate-binding protein